MALFQQIKNPWLIITCILALLGWLATRPFTKTLHRHVPAEALINTWQKEKHYVVELRFMDGKPNDTVEVLYTHRPKIWDIRLGKEDETFEVLMFLQVSDDFKSKQFYGVCNVIVLDSLTRLLFPE